MPPKPDPYKVTKTGREFVASGEFKDNVARIFSDLRQQDKTKDEILVAASVYAATCLVMDGSREMDVDVGKLREFILRNQKDIREALGKALPASGGKK